MHSDAAIATEEPTITNYKIRIHDDQEPNH